MPTSTLFWIATALVVIGQIMILRSTVRAMRGASSPRARRGIEWSYAIVPVLALALVLVATWRAAARHHAPVPAVSETTR
jgi:Na+/proline symporter